MSVREIVVSACAADRLGRARSWLEAITPGTPTLVLAHSLAAADDLVRSVAAGKGAVFAIHRLTLNHLAGLLAAEQTASAGRSYVSDLGMQAVAARALFTLEQERRLDALAAVRKLPGLPRALAATYSELAEARCSFDRLEELGVYGSALAATFAQLQLQLREAGLADRAAIFAAAIAAIEEERAIPELIAVPTLLLDCAVDNVLERDLIAALADRAPSLLATLPIADRRSRAFLRDALRSPVSECAPEPMRPQNSLARVQRFLFDRATLERARLDDSISVTSAAGEMQECVEIARCIRDAARRGTPFDQIAVLLHAPARYTALLEEAFARASIPAWFARGTIRPEPGGRALLALLSCAAENFSARRFAEYLSLAQVPTPDAAASEPAFFVPPEPEFMPDPRRLAADPPPTPPAEEEPSPTLDGSTRAPWRWERVLLDAAVIHGHARWRGRLEGLEHELRLRRRELDEDDARAHALDRAMVDLAHLRDFALPVIDHLAGLPTTGTWGDWLTHLRALVALAVRDRAPVLAALAELEPMAPVGGITLDEVRIVLSERMGRLERPPAARRYGAVFVAPTALARGLEFELVIVPGLAERILPQKLGGDPLLPDAARRRLNPCLRTQEDRAAAERLALALAIGAARTRVMLSYPRMDLDQGRPRVPSFYALEILRAAEGELPGFDELARRAAGESRARLGWPAPESPLEAIDEAEFDLAVLDRIAEEPGDRVLGAAHYLLDTNPHLGRALRARARSWLHRWTRNDGLVDPTDAERAALAVHQLDARAYSGTALQHFAACPYRFYLQAIVRLSPRDEIAALEAIDPLTRGSLCHEAQFETLSALRAAGRLPLSRATLDEGYAVLERCLSEVAARACDELAPAIERVWLDGIDSLRADLREWLRRMAEEEPHYCPERFELSFGLSDRRQRDPASVAEAVALEAGLRLRGAIDLIERGPDGLRVTDYKTGKVRAPKGLVIGGGKVLQPVLYALAAERLLTERVVGGRLYYCTAAGGYEERVVPLDETAREAIALLAEVIGKALREGFLPAAPDTGECDFCDYRLLCGPYEQRRIRYKRETGGAQQRLADLDRLRARP